MERTCVCCGCVLENDYDVYYVFDNVLCGVGVVFDVRRDIFQLVAMNKMELTNNQQREGQARFVPITFTTNSGASIGAKHFAGVEIDDNAPAVGSTPLENANFLVWCIDHNVSFKVRNVTSEEVEAHDNVPGYTKKTYKLEVDSYE